MIAGIGIDLVDLATTAERVARPAFLAKVYTAAEIAACRRAPQETICFAAHFALKEALMKALGAGIRQGLWFTQVEVRNALGTQPAFTLRRRALERFQDCGVSTIRASVTATGGLVVGMVMLD